MKGFRVLGEPLFSRGITSRLRLGSRMGAVGVAYSISGTVYDADGITPVSGATIALGAYAATSAADGTYTITDIPPNTSGSMTCTKTGYSWAVITIAAMTGNLTSQNYTNAWWAVGGIAASCVVAYAPKGAASLAASYINLKNPGTNNAAPGTAPTWDATNGWKFAAASSQYLTCGIIARTLNQSVIVKYSNCTAVTGAAIGSKNPIYLISPYNAGSTEWWDNGSAKSKAFVAAGVLGKSAKRVYWNGALTDTIAGSPGVSAEAYYIGAWNDANTPGFFGNLYIQALAIYNIELSDSQMAALTTAMNAIP